MAFARVCFADGFEERPQYLVKQGDLNGDGLVDVYVREKPNIVVIPLDDLTIPIAKPPHVVSFALMQGANHTFTLRTDLGGLNLSAAGASQVILTPMDVDMDANIDAVLTGMSTVVTGALDYVVFASGTSGLRNVPASILAMDANLKSFFEQLNGWIEDPAYFVNTAVANNWLKTVQGPLTWAWYAADYLQYWGYLYNGIPIIYFYEDTHNPNYPPDSCYYGYFNCYYDGFVWEVLVPVQQTYVTVDWSRFNQNALNAATQLDLPIARDALPVGSTNASGTATIFTSVLGGRPFYGGTLGSSEGRLPYEVDYPVDDLATLRVTAIKALAQAVATVPTPAAPPPAVTPLTKLPGVSVTENPIKALDHGTRPQAHAVVLHRTDSSTVTSALNAGKSSKTGATFYVDKDGKIYQTVNLESKTYHAGIIKSKCLDNPTTCSAPDQQAATTALGQNNYEALANHEKTKSYPARYPYNDDAVGIEVVGKYNATTQTWDALTTDQQNSLNSLVNALKTKYSLQNTDIYHHDTISRKTAGEGAGMGW
jgi:hypothetical protein